MTETAQDITFPATDGFQLTGTLYPTSDSSAEAVIIINAAMAIPRRFYRHCAIFMASNGYTTLTYDYRGIGNSAPQNLRGFEALARDWAEYDMAGAIQWVQEQLSSKKLFVIGHSVGGQLMGIVPNAHQVDAMVTTSSQSGYWLMQGGFQKIFVGFHMYVTFPLLTGILGYMPWSRFAAGEDLPYGVAREWASWCRNPRYVLGDKTLPLGRYQQFTAPVLAYSFADDSWGTRKSVDAMMSAYPRVERRHVRPTDIALRKIGHVGFFRKSAKPLWEQTLAWFKQQSTR